MKVKFVERLSNLQCVCCITDKKEVFEKLKIKAETGKTVLVMDGPLPKVLSFCEDSSPENLRKAAASALWKLEETQLEEVKIEVDLKLTSDGAQALAEGLGLGGYAFDKYKNEKKELYVEVAINKDLKPYFNEGVEIAEITNYVRDLVNIPATDAPPEAIAEEALSLREMGAEVKVVMGERLKDLGLVGTWHVGKGSKNPPAFVTIKYKSENPLAKLALVGKGVTFDSGGLSLKPPASMEDMKCDKAGACSILGVAKYLLKKRPNLDVNLYMPLAENLPDGGSYKPGDVIVFRNGVSVEIHSTDAEGRLLLADALIEASTQKKDYLIDVATLTGACMVALGRYTSGLFCTSQTLCDMFLKVSRFTGEKLWPLPLDEDLEKELKTDFADTRNNAKGRYGGAITAALFLKKFVDNKNVKAWAHLDIAGPAFLEGSWKYYKSGATGQPVRTLIKFLELVEAQENRNQQ